MDHSALRIDPPRSASDELSFRADIVPAQFYGPRRGSASIEPILRLMAGVLIDAVRSFQRNFESRYPSRRQEFREARLWIFDEKGDGPFSFRDVCAALEIDPRRLRQSIIRWEKDRRSGDRHEARRSSMEVAGLIQSRS